MLLFGDVSLCFCLVMFLCATVWRWYRAQSEARSLSFSINFKCEMIVLTTQ